MATEDKAPSISGKLRRSRVRKGFAILVVLMALLVTTAGTTVWWFGTRPDGLQQALHFADGLGGVRLTASGVTGPIAGPFRVQHLVVTHSRVTVAIDDLHGELRLGALVYGTVGVRELAAHRVQVTLHPTAEPPRDTGFLPAWLRLAWDELRVERLEVLRGGADMGANANNGARAAAPMILRSLHATGSLSRWTLRAMPLSARWQDWTAHGDLRLDAGHAVALQWQGRLDGPVLSDGPAWQTRASISGEIPANAKTQRWQFAAQTQRPAGLQAKGEIALGPDLWRVTGSYSASALDLAPWGLGAPGKLGGALAGTVAKAAAPEAVDIQMAGQLTASALAPLGVGELQGKLRARALPGTLQLQELALRSKAWGSLALTGESAAARGKLPPFARFNGHWALPGSGQVALNAEALWPSGALPHWKLRASGQQLHPEPLVGWPPFSLALDMNGSGFALPGSAQGRNGAQHMGARAKATDAESMRESSWDIHRLELHASDSYLEVRGRLGRQGRADGALAIADLSRWLPGQAGRLEAKFHGEELTAAGGRFGVQIDAAQLGNSSWPLPVVSAQLNATGEWQGAALAANVTRFDATPGGVWQPYGAVRLRSPGDVRWRQGAFDWSELCLELGAGARLGSVCTHGKWASSAPWEVEARAEGLELLRWLQSASAAPSTGTSNAAAAAQAGLHASLRGTAQARLVFGGDGVRRHGATSPQNALANLTHGQLDVQLADGEVRWERDGNAGKLPLGETRASATLRPASAGQAPTIELGASANAAPGLLLQVRAETQPAYDLSWRQWPLKGELSGKLPALGFLPVLFEDLDRVAGELAAQLRLGGTLGLPDYRGQLQLRGGELDIVPLNLQLRQVQATLALAPGELTLDGSAKAGTGELQTHGRLAFGNGRALTGDITLTGQQLLLADVPEARLVAAPDLRFTLQGDELRVAGKVLVPSARLAPQDLTGVVLPSTDERLVGEQRDTNRALRTDTRVQVVLGSDVHLDTLGLSGRLQGTLTAHAPPEGTTTGSGELAIIGGKFKAYTRELDVEKGRLLFTGGPLADPGLDLRASRQFPGVKAGVLVRGTLRRPLVRFFSDPAKTQNEIASLLVVGRSLEGLQGTGGTGSALNSATARDTALQQGGALLAAQVGKYVGLDEVQLERDQNDAAALVLGKYLSPRLYVSYGVGLTTALNTLKLRYTLGNRWVIKTEAGSRQSLDLEYTTEH
ncbi:MAG: hypothetical protein RJB26_2142 [Pseudomonadota bacterium]